MVSHTAWFDIDFRISVFIKVSRRIDELGSDEMKNFLLKKCCRRPGEVELFGLILLIIGVVTICAFLLPSKIWLIILGGLMIFCGYKLFTC